LRRAFLSRVGELIKNEEDTVFFTVDIGMWAIREALEKYPDRCTNVGIYEDGMFSIAAGMSKCGLVPIIFGIQPYLIERTLEQIKMDFAYMKNGVNVVATGASIDYPKYGYSHYCAEDAALIKLIPGCEFIAPGTANEFIKLFNQAYRNGNPSFFRISDHPNKDYDIDVKFGKANLIKKGNKATVIVVSVMLDSVMKVCKDMDVTVLYYTTLEPFDRDILAKNCESSKLLICEPEYEGTLLNDVYSAFKGRNVAIEQVAFPREIFRNYGTYEEKMNYYGLNEQNIREKLIKLIDEKVC
jgi:hypothetical protein